MTIDSMGYGAMTGALQAYGDADYFQFVAPSNARGDAMLVLDNSGDVDGVLSLYDSSGRRVARVNVGKTGDTEVLNYTGIRPGETYVARVGGAKYASVGSYSLEVRLDRDVRPAKVLPSRIVVDFSPDLIDGETQPNPFVHIFTGASGEAIAVDDNNRFLDCNKSGEINENDARRAVKKIMSYVRELFRPLDKKGAIDIDYRWNKKLTTGDPGIGEKALAAGKASQDLNTYVIYVGDEREDARFPRFGMAEQAEVNSQGQSGVNNEFYGFVFAGEIAEYMQEQKPNGDLKYCWGRPGQPLQPRDFTAFVGAAIAHEVGHLVGLGDICKTTQAGKQIPARNFNYVMNSPYYANPKRMSFYVDKQMSNSILRHGQMELREWDEGFSDSYSYTPFTDFSPLVELYESFATGADGEFEQFTFTPNLVYQSLADPRGFGDPDSYPADVFLPPDPVVPDPLLGEVGTTTVTDVIDELSSGFTTFRQDVLGGLGRLIDLPEGTLPFVPDDLAATLDIASRVESSLGDLFAEGSTPGTMAELATELGEQGFNIVASVSDTEFDNLPADEAADFVRVSRTYDLDDLTTSISFSPDALNGLEQFEQFGLSGSLDVRGDLQVTITFGVDTGGFYLLPGNVLYAPIFAGGEVSANAGPLSVSASADLGLTAALELSTDNADSRVRLEELIGELDDYVTLVIEGGAALNLEATAEIPVLGAIELDGRWLWDLDEEGTGFSLRESESGFDEDSLVDSLAEILGAGVNELASHSESLVGFTDNIPLLGSNISAAVQTLFVDGLNYDNDVGFARDFFASQGFEILPGTATVDELIAAVVDGTDVDLLRLRYTRDTSDSFSETTSYEELAGAGTGSLNLGLQPNLSGTLSGNGSLDVNLVVGLDTSGGVFVEEGGTFVNSLGLIGQLSGNAQIAGLAEVNLSGTAAIDTTVTLTLDDQDDGDDGRLYIFGTQAIADAFLSTETGMVGLQDVSVTATIPALASILPPIGWTGSVTYDLVSGDSTVTWDDTSLQESLASVVIKGINELGTQASSLAQLARDIPVIGDNVGDGLAAIIGDGLVFDRGDQTALDYLATRNVTVVADSSITVDDLLAGDLDGEDLICFHYQKTRSANPLYIDVGDYEWSYGVGDLDVGFNLSGQNIEIEPSVAFDIVFGVDLAGPYIAEAKATGDPPTLMATLDVEGGVGGSLSVGSLLGVDVSAPFSFDGSAGLRLNDFDGIENEKFYLFSVGDQDALSVVDIVADDETRQKAIALDGTVALNGATCSLSSGAALPSVLSDLWQEGFQWTVDAWYNLATGESDFKVREDSHFNEIFAAFTGSEGKGSIFEGLLGHIDDYNPLPEFLREALTADLPILQQSVLELMGAGNFEILVNPGEFQERLQENDDGTSCIELGEGTEGDRLQLHLDFMETGNITSLLSGGSADIIRLDVEQSFDLSGETPVVPPTLIASYLGILNATLDVSLLPSLSLHATPTIGFDTDGFYFEAAPDVITLGGEITGEVGINGSLTVVPLARVTADVGLGVEVDIGLRSPRDDDDKVRIEDLEDLENIPLAFELFVDLGLAGEVGLIETSFTEKIEDEYRIVLYRDDGTAQDVEEEIKGFKDKLERAGKNAKAAACLGAAAINPGLGVVVCGMAYEDELREGLANVNETFNKAIDDIGAEGKRALATAAKAVGRATSEARAAGRRFDKEVLQPLARATGLKTLINTFDIGGWGEWEPVAFDAKQTFTTSLSGGTLTVRWKPNLAEQYELDEKGGDIGIAVIDGEVVVDGPDFEVRETVAQKKAWTYYALKPPKWHWEYREEDVTHSNIYTVAASKVDEIVVIGSDYEDVLIVDADTNIPVELNGGDDDDTLIGGGGDDTLYGGDGDDLLVGNDGDDELYGQKHEDTLQGGKGDDTLKGGEHDDLLDEKTGGKRGRSRERNVLDGGDDEDTLWGSPGDDTLWGGNDNDTLSGRDGEDVLHGEGGDDYLSGGDDNDDLYGDENDDYLLGGDGRDYLEGGTGNDDLFGDDEGTRYANRDTLYGGSGQDLLGGGGGDDQLYGGSHADVIRGNAGNDNLVGEGGNDLLDGGDGQDTLSGGASGNGEDVNSEAGGYHFDFLRGGDGPDLIEGNSGPDRVDGGGGNDTIRGGTGNDTLVGGTGDDIIEGQDGADTLEGGFGFDTVYGGNQNDQIIGGEDDDRLYGDAGQDTIYGSGGNDVVYGGIDGDELHGNWGNDTIYGEAGRDTIEGNCHDDWVYGGDDGDTLFGDATSSASPGQDHVFGEAGNDDIQGNDKDDVLDGGVGNDTIRGNGGSDQIYGADGNDSLEGGTGSDFVYGDSGNDIVKGNENADVLRGDGGLDTIYGGAGQDTLFGNSDDDHLYGEADDDQLYGGLGADTLHGDDEAGATTGDDTLHGESGRDSLYGDRGDDLLLGEEDADLLHGNDGRDTLLGGVGNDELFGDANGDLLDGQDDADTLHGNAGRDTLHAGAGADDVYGDEDEDLLYGDSGDNTLHGGLNTDTLHGGTGNDLLDGDGDNDLLYGETGRNTLLGNAGNDTLYAGTGGDVLAGGTGNDFLQGGDANDVLWGGAIEIDHQYFNLTDTALPPQFAEALANTSYQPPQNVMPLEVAGQSRAGDALDGQDTLRGGGNTDWLFGGGDRDDLNGEDGHDYVDGGAGNDSACGGAGDDVVRGGAGEDVVHGNAGIDQVYGDDGADRLYGDQGDGDGNQRGQRLWGGAGVDYLYANATTNPSELTEDGDELHGGPDGDWLYGNLRCEVLVGEGGNDTIYGDYLAGSDYARSDTPHTAGANDTLYGDSGEDRLFGGGGDDELWGGADSDRLTGQDGHDSLYGGGWIDKIILDVDPDFTVLGDEMDGHFGNRLQNDTPDDNATDILVIEGDQGEKSPGITEYDDTITLSETSDGRLRVEYTRRAEDILVTWRDPSGTPLVEQFEVFGLMGHDCLTFATVDAVDVSDLDARSNDWIGVLNGGPGNDTLRGSNGRDQLDGGIGDDELYGYGGDDRLWGNFAGTGGASDFDILFAGSGNDDLIGGQGENRLYAWSQNPEPVQFGIFIFDEDKDGLPDDGVYYNSDLDGIDGNTYVPEDTGLNRMLGSEGGNDSLYGGTGLDFLYGNGGDDKLYTHDGELFEARGDNPFASDNAWKDYARATDKVWYYSGTNADDVITVDFVTEPGLLGDHHLITRLTSNNGNYSFDAQVQLDFAAHDEDGNLIWNPQDRILGMALLGSADAPADGRLSGDACFALSVDGDMPVPVVVPHSANSGAGEAVTEDNSSIDDLIDDLNAALEIAGLADQVIAQRLDNRVALARRTSEPGEQTTLVINQVNAVTADELHFTEEQAGTVQEVDLQTLSGLLPPEGDFLAIIIDALAGDDQITVGPTVQKTVWIDAGRDDDVVEIKAGNAILVDQTEREFRNDDASHAYVLSEEPLQARTIFKGLTIDNPDDVDWYEFQLAEGLSSTATVELHSDWDTDGLGLALFQRAGDDAPTVLAYGRDLPDLSDQPNDTWQAAYSLDRITSLAGVSGLTIHDQTDADWFWFTLPNTGTADDALALAQLAGGALQLQLLDATGAEARPPLNTAAGDVVTMSLEGLAANGADGYYLGISLGCDLQLLPSLQNVGDLPTEGKSQVIVADIQGVLHFRAFDADGITVVDNNETELADKAQQISDLKSLLSSLWNASSLSQSDRDSVIASVTSIVGHTVSLDVSCTAGSARYQLWTSIGNRGYTELDLSGGNKGRIDLDVCQPEKSYLLQVTSPNLVPTRYDLEFQLGAGDVTTIDLSTRSDTHNRRDVILGGPGNDVLAGGPGEDWIFGGPGNDVLTGGLDRQASDLLFGGEDDDTFQIIPDSLPFIKGTETTLVPTLTDQFFGGDGEDRVLFLGGDLDRNSQPVPDYVAMRYNTVLHRYEWASRVWDIENQEYLFTGPTPALLLAQDQVTEVDLGGDLTFQLAANGGDNVTITVPWDSDDDNGDGTRGNQTVEDLVNDLNAALTLADISSEVVARSDDGRIALVSTSLGSSAELKVTFAPSDPVKDKLKFTLVDGELSAKGQDQVYEQQYVFYRAQGRRADGDRNPRRRRRGPCRVRMLD